MSTQTVEQLTERELEILAAIVDGLSNQEIANKYHLAVKTVKWYNTQIYSKLNVANRQEAVERAGALRLLEQELDPIHTPNNFPQETTPFIGREAELGEINTMLQNSDSRLITILGPGGMGKTRLSLQVAQEQLRYFEDGVFLVKLAGVTKPDDILLSIVEIFQLYNYGDAQDTLEQSISQYLRSKHLLLILDNFEHLLEGAAQVMAILQAAPHVKILVTSRERLNLKGEQVYILKGMEIPFERHREAGDYDAARLFVQAVQRIRTDYQLTADDWPHVARICQLVGGMPLGVELAAGWMDMLTAEKIADEIAQCLDILETEMRDMPDRHRSIRASLDQTWERLSEGEKHLLMRISVFRGGFTQEAAEAVANTNLRILRHLTNKALIYHTLNRYEIHELVRQYSEEKLRESGHYDEAIERYMTYFTDYLEPREMVILELDKRTFLEMRPEIENIIQVWDHALAAERFDLLARMRGAFREIMGVEGNTFKELELFEAAADATAAIPEWNLLYATLKADIAMTHTHISSSEYMRQLGHESIQLLEPHGPTAALSLLYRELGFHYFEAPPVDRDYGQELMMRALEIARQTGNATTISEVLHSLTIVYLYADDEQQAWHYASQLDDLIKEQGHDANPAWQLYLRGQLLIHSGDYDEAEVCLNQLLESFSSFQWVFGIADIRRNLSRIHLAQNNLKAAREQVAAAIKIHQDYAQDWQTLGALWGNFGQWHLIEVGEYEYAAVILSFVHHHPISTGNYRQWTAHFLGQIEAELDPETYQAAVERGKTMKLSQVVEDALAYLSAE